MGRYIQGPTFGKSQYIMDNYGAVHVSMPKSFSEVPEGRALICVVLNGPFEAAMFVHSEGEFNAVRHPDNRPRQFLMMDRKKACELTGHPA